MLFWVKKRRLQSDRWKVNLHCSGAYALLTLQLGIVVCWRFNQRVHFNPLILLYMASFSCWSL